MKICAAQPKPVRGDIGQNIENHKKMINAAVSEEVDIIIFPELSITGYEPEMAKKLATDENDPRFDDFQKTSDAEGITIGIGMPTNNEKGICISLIIFQPRQARQIYSKKYLHGDEKPFFVGGDTSPLFTINDTKIAPVICYELSVPDHSEEAHRNGAQIYLASVANTARGVERAAATLSEIAAKYAMTVLVANSVGLCADGLCAGKTSVWNEQGLLIGQLGEESEGILIIDTETQESFSKIV